MAQSTIIVRNLRALRRLLKRHEIPISAWGEGATKSVEDLLREILEGESTLIRSKKEGLVRHVSRAQASIYHAGPDGLLFLREEKQVFANGAERRRDQAISVSEKRRCGESARSAMVRGIREELDIVLSDPSCLVRQGKPIVSSAKPSRSYPGLTSQHRMTRYRWDMPGQHYRPDGYVERQPNKETHFGWRKAE